MHFSLIIPVFNRPDEIAELLQSLAETTYNKDFEVVIIEDGSTNTCKTEVAAFENQLQISYYFKENSGPGDSRNYGMKKAKGDYFIIFDSDCIIPTQYLSEVDLALNSSFAHCFGGPDSALDSFSDIQKAINFAMTSFLTTGGIRGGSEKIDKFQPRSFNMGLSKIAFEASGGFGNIHPGEDPDLSMRLWKLGFETKLFSRAYVYHKRRIDWQKFEIQVGKFGKARPILNSWYPEYAKITYFFPSIFIVGIYIAALISLVGFPYLLILYVAYFLTILIVASAQTQSVKIGWYSVIAVWKQFYRYGNGFLISYLKIIVLKREPRTVFPELFF